MANSTEAACGGRRGQAGRQAGSAAEVRRAGVGSHAIGAVTTAPVTVRHITPAHRGGHKVQPGPCTPSELGHLQLQCSCPRSSARRSAVSAAGGWWWHRTAHRLPPAPLPAPVSHFVPAGGAPHLSSHSAAGWSNLGRGDGLGVGGLAPYASTARRRCAVRAAQQLDTRCRRNKRRQLWWCSADLAGGPNCPP